MKILILEDFYFRVNEFKKRFELIGITDITHVNTAKECIKMLSEKVFDVIFLDYHLDNIEFEVINPENTGAKVAEWLKNNPDNPNNQAKIIIHSGSEIGATEIQKYLPNTPHIKGAWKEKIFAQVIELLDI